MINNYETIFLNYIKRLYEAINGETINFDSTENAINGLMKFLAKQEYNYLNILLYPEKIKGMKIPSPIPIPSCCFQLRCSIDLQPNSSGNLAIMFNPYFLGDREHFSSPFNVDVDTDKPYAFSRGSYTTFFYNNHNSLNGKSSNSFWTMQNIGQEIPNVYDQYRLVSACMVVKYIAKMDNVSGVIGSAIVFNETNELGGLVVAIDENTHTSIEMNFMPKMLNQYGNFDLAMDSFYHQESYCLEGTRVLYFPLDKSYNEYTKILNSQLTSIKGRIRNKVFEGTYTANETYYKSGFWQMVYVMGAAKSANFKIDIYCNFECLPNAKFMDYLPQSINNNYNDIDIKKAIETVQKKPIGKYDENINPPRKTSILDQIKNKLYK